MQTIGVRELRQDASRWLARVRAGETFVVTDRGRPVAQLAPLTGEPVGYDALLAAGRIRPGRGGDVWAALDAIGEADDGPLASDVLEELRSGERY